MLSVFRNITIKSTSTEEKLGEIACFKCRKDRKKCDKRLPICSRCSQLKVDCRPYVRSLKNYKLPSGINKLILNENKELDAGNKDKNRIIIYNSLTSSLSISRHISITSGASINYNFNEYSKIMFLLSSSSDVVILRNSEDNIDPSLPVSFEDPTLSPSFWDELLRLYFTEFHLVHSLFSLQNFSMGKEYWIRTNLIYCIAYAFSTIKSPIASIKMEKLLNISEYYLNRSPPSLSSLQCYLLLYILYRNTGDLKKKKKYFHSAIKVSHLIGLPNRCKGITPQCQYDRDICFIKLIQLYWVNIQYSDSMGLSLESVDISPKFNLEWQLIDPISSTEVDLVVANNITQNIKFAYSTQTYVISPFMDYIKKQKIDIDSITQLEFKLDEIYSNIKKKLMRGPFSDFVSNHIRIYYLVVKHQLNSVLLKETNDAQLQIKYIELNYNIIKVILKSYSIVGGYLIAAHTILQSVLKLKESFSEEHYRKIDDLILIITNILQYSNDFKLISN